MDTVDRLSRDIDRAVKAKGHIGAIDIIVDRLRKMDDIQPFLPQQIRSLLRTISAEDYKTVQTELVIILLHCLYFIEAFFIRLTHQLERLPGRSEDRTALRQNTGKITGGQKPVITIDQTFVAIHKAVYLQLREVCGKTLYHAAHRRIERLTVSAARQKSYSLHSSSHPSFFMMKVLVGRYISPTGAK